MAAKSMTVLSFFKTMKRLGSSSRYDLTFGTHNTGLVCWGSMFFFFVIYFSIDKTNSFEGLSVDISNLFLGTIFWSQFSNAWSSFICALLKYIYIFLGSPLFRSSVKTFLGLLLSTVFKSGVIKYLWCGSRNLEFSQ